MAQFKKKKKVTEHKIQVLTKLMSETFLNIRRTEQDKVTNVYWASHKVLVILVISE
jgi:hypothetical protein